MTFSSFFEIITTPKTTHIFTTNTCGADADIDQLARLLAESIVRELCGRRCQHHFQAWQGKAQQDVPLPNEAQSHLRATLRLTFGLPNEVVEDNHLEGAVGEWLWYFVSLESPNAPIAHIEPPGLKATDHGGDGLIIHRMPADDDRTFMFRLWEMKKYVPEPNSGSTVSGVISNAYNQLNASAAEYLARYVRNIRSFEESELDEFCGRLVTFWLEASPNAAAGIAVATSTEHMPQRCFTTFGNQFPNFVNPVRLCGMITTIADFAAFAKKVQEEIWKGL